MINYHIIVIYDYLYINIFSGQKRIKPVAQSYERWYNMTNNSTTFKQRSENNNFQGNKKLRLSQNK
jgi:hypothetical protein